MDSGGCNSHLVNYVDEVSGHCEVRLAFDKAPHVPIVGTSTASMLHEKVQVNVPFSDDVIALRAVDMYFENSLLLLAQSANPQEVRDSFRAEWLRIFGPPAGIQMGGGGGRKNEIWTDSRAERRIKF